MIRQLRGRLADMEKNLPIVYAGSAVAKKKAEIAAELEKYVREELVNVMNSLSCKYLQLVDLFIGCAYIFCLAELDVLQLLTLGSRWKSVASTPVLKRSALCWNLIKYSGQIG